MSIEERRRELLDWLQIAFELELGTIPPYMMALLSIKLPGNRVPAALIRSVMMEEMLHLLLVGNLIASLGGKIVLGPENIPTYPLSFKFQGERFKDRLFDVDLAPFSVASLDVFLKIELPDRWAKKPYLMALAAHEVVVPGLTIGDFYRKIVVALEQLCGDFGEEAVFDGIHALQPAEGFYWAGGGKPMRVSDLASAKTALMEIVAQGEGGTHKMDDGDGALGQPAELAHFFRFREIQFARHYLPGDKPRAAPTGTAFEVDYQAVYPIRVNPRAVDYTLGSELAVLNESFNCQYTAMLGQLAESMNGTPNAMYTAIMNGMHSLTPIARQMIQLPVRPGAVETGAPSFEWLA